MAGPLDHGTLREIERSLSEGRLDDAQQGLAAVDPNDAPADGVAYLATRLLYHRGRLTAGDAAERVRELLSARSDFPEAQSFVSQLGVAESPEDAPTSGRERASAEPTRSSSPRGTAPRTPMQGGGGLSPAQPLSSGRPSTPIPRRHSAPPLPPSNRPADSTRRRPVRNETPPLGSAAAKAHSAPAPAREAASETDDEVPRILSPISDLEGLSDGSPNPNSGGAPLIPKAPPVPQVGTSGRLTSEPPLRARSSLPPGAGRYSQAPKRTESIRPGASRHPPQAKPSEAPSQSPSSAPPNAQMALEQGAELLKQERFAEALELLDRANFQTANDRAQAALLRSQAFAGLEFHQQAVSELSLLDLDPAMQAEHRAHGAELLAQMGQFERAIEQAVKALDASDGTPAVRLRFAAVIVQSARHRNDDFLMDQANRALANVRATGEQRTRLLGLRSCILARIGSADRAIELASEAITLDSKSVDAYAALAEAACRNGNIQRARDALTQLQALSPAQAQALMPRLGPLNSVRPEPATAASPAQAHASSPATRRSSAPPSADPSSNWTERCIASLHQGNRGAALEILRNLARDRAKSLPRAPGDSEPPELASTAATFLTRAPIFNSFPPYDLSLWSIARLEASLDTLLGKGSWPQSLEPDDPLLVMLASYLGETLRQAHQGRWSPIPNNPNRSRVVVGHRGWDPYELIIQRFKHGNNARIERAIPSALLNPGSGPWQHRILNPVVSSRLQALQDQPFDDALPRIADEFSSGPVGLFCNKVLRQPLDGSLSCIGALERYLDLLAPGTSPAEPEAAWARPIALRAGAYYGQLLVSAADGVWTPVVSSTNLDRYRVLVRGGEIYPMLEVYRRLSDTRGKKLSRPGGTPPPRSH